MKALLVAAMMLLSTAALAQQQERPPYNPPPHSTPPTFPDGSSSRQLPPDMRAPAHEELSTSDIEKQLGDRINVEPALQRSDIHATVDDKSIVLTGMVDSEQQRESALRIARSYAGDREVVDKLELRGRT
jgi:hypothetical protein